MFEADHVILCTDGRLEDSRAAASSDSNDGRLVRAHQQSSSLEINPSYGVISRTTENTVQTQQTQVTTTRAEVYEVMNASHSSTREPQT